MTPSQTSPKPTVAAELRRAFLGFFEKNGHTVVPSSPLVPSDPTLLFTTAGMVQFKPYYLAGGDVPYDGRAVSIQKCLRLTDLENVGYTPRHDTFFEMLGNFSFGARDKGAYFKTEAIEYAWKFVTETLGMPRERLYMSIFAGEGALPRDDEAAALWKKMGVAPDHIVALGRKDNFWGPAGGAGACGPCSEIYFDLGEKRPAYLADGAFWGEKPGDDGDRYMEFWNLVFPQFDAQKDGTLTPLARPGIDTGMGLERLALIMQGKSIIFETDLFAPVVDEVRALATRAPRNANAAVRDARIVADHVRGLTFAIAEGALPGNEGAGYVLRRLLRRAVTRGRSKQGLAIREAFLSRAADRIIADFGGHYRELKEQRGLIERVLAQEEAQFSETFEAGLTLLEREFDKKPKSLAGDLLFKLHDTYGFPIELTEEIAAERGIAVDREGFERAMDEQRHRARAASKFTKTAAGDAAPWTDVTKGADSEFLGYDAVAADGLTLRRWREAGENLELVLDRTPCYAESGGQVADGGTLEGGGAVATLEHVYKEGDAIVHRLALRSGTRDALLAAGRAGQLSARVDAALRLPTERHHTATHLLHAILRRTLGTHVRQAGSLVAPDRLRFDYTHFEAPQREQLDAIERAVNEWVLADREVSWRVMPIAEAKAQGAMALFGEKYGAEVRMVTVDGVDGAGIEPSRELCGGTHVRRTGEIGAFKLVGESAIASGVRRIEALCGLETLRWIAQQSEWLNATAHGLLVAPAQLPGAVEKLKSELEGLRKADADAKKSGLASEMLKLADSAEHAPGGSWVVARIGSEADANAVREAADALRLKLKRGALVLALASGDKLTFVAAVSDDLVAEKKLRADELVRAVAKVTGGSGGGKPHLALAGGKDASQLDAALDEARKLIRQALA